jgi:hypothetical protein
MSGEYSAAIGDEIRREKKNEVETWLEFRR